MKTKICVDGIDQFPTAGYISFEDVLLNKNAFFSFFLGMNLSCLIWDMHLSNKLEV